MSIETVRIFIKEVSEEFGAKTEGGFSQSYIERKNIGVDALKDNGAFFGFIRPEEDTSGPYHDFSLVLFPNDENKAWLVCLGIGSSGFKNDYELATFPGLRRLFSKLIDERGFCKSDFTDIETNLPKTVTGNKDLEHIKKTIEKYSKVLSVCQIVDDPETIGGKEIIRAFVAAYAKLREWPTNEKHRRAITSALIEYTEKQTTNEVEVIQTLLKERKYVILEGPPGTGKTRTAKQIALSMDAKTFFTQFHAETSYSDFIYGIRPSLNGNDLGYVEKMGAFTDALQYAKENPTQTTILIIDEINRANLSNVLGPIFYLFEHKMDITGVEIEISPTLKLSQLPANFYVIATMNTADRSLAVVDFALRRRFAWFTFKPRPIEADNFFKEDFFKIQDIFNWYATSSELLLQPGQGYFIASSEEEMRNRIEYELYPLIKEYLNEGLIRSSKEEFNDYFSQRIKKSLFE